MKVGITHGDLNGIGYEIIMKTFHDPRMLESITPVVYGSSKVASYHRKSLNISEINLNLVKNAQSAVPKRMNIINVTHDEIKIELGKSTEVAGLLAFRALEAAVKDLLNNNIDVLVTAPINKKNIRTSEFPFAGHSEYLASMGSREEYLMLMVCDNLRIGVATGHISLREVPNAITTEGLSKKIELMNKSLISDFGIMKPKIAVLGLNPHAGDSGMIGEEDNQVILPAIEQAWNKNMLVYGPFSADGFFGSTNFHKFDGILAMYHDQGMIPFKTLSFDKGVNFTAGLPFVRTSPAHGTAYDIAGKNLASHNSFREAVYLAIDIFNNRKALEEIKNNPLPNYLKELEHSSDAVIEKEIPHQTEDIEPDNLVTGN